MLSFQTIVATDYANTYAKHTYNDRAMNWSVVLDSGTQPNYPARKGFLSLTPAATTATTSGATTSTTATRHYDEYKYSYADVRSVTGTNAVQNLIDKIEKIDAVQEATVAYNGDVKPGRFAI